MPQRDEAKRIKGCLFYPMKKGDVGSYFTSFSIK